MAIPDKRQIEKLKKEDAELEKISLKSEEAKLKKDESHLRKLLKPQLLEVDLKKMEKDRKALLKKGRK